MNDILQKSYARVASEVQPYGKTWYISHHVWIISANSMVRHIIHKCVPCHRLRGKLESQKMADLPDKRCMEAAPFTYSGVNMF